MYAWFMSARALAALCYTTLALILSCKGQPGPPERETASELRPVGVPKPLHGLEPDLLRNLASFCWQDYPASLCTSSSGSSAMRPAASHTKPTGEGACNSPLRVLFSLPPSSRPRTRSKRERPPPKRVHHPTEGDPILAHF